MTNNAELMYSVVGKWTAAFRYREPTRAYSIKKVGARAHLLTWIKQGGGARQRHDAAIESARASSSEAWRRFEDQAICFDQFQHHFKSLGGRVGLNVLAPKICGRRKAYYRLLCNCYDFTYDNQVPSLYAPGNFSFLRWTVVVDADTTLRGGNISRATAYTYGYVGCFFYHQQYHHLMTCKRAMIFNMNAHTRIYPARSIEDSLPNAGERNQVKRTALGNIASRNRTDEHKTCHAPISPGKCIDAESRLASQHSTSNARKGGRTYRLSWMPWRLAPSSTRLYA
eukprot:203514-Pleurochrysis_carterae.AAC.1